MKLRIKHFSKSTLSTVLALCMLLSCVMVGHIPTDAAEDSSEKIGSGTYDIFIVPKSSWFEGNNTITVNVHYDGNNANDGNWRNTDTFSDEGYTVEGKRVFKASVYLPHDGFRCLQYDSDSTYYTIVANSDAWKNANDYFNKLYDEEGTSVWKSSWTPDTYTLKGAKGSANGTAISDVTMTNNSNVYTCNVTLDADSDYYFNVNDGSHYWANSNSSSSTLCRYDNGGSTDKVKFHTTVKGTYSVRFALNTPGSRPDAGTISITSPTTNTVTIGSHTNGSLSVVTGDYVYEQNSTTYLVHTGKSYTIKAKPNTGYTLSSLKVGNTTLSTTGPDSSGYYTASTSTTGTLVATYSEASYTGVKAAVSVSPSRSGVATATPSTGQNVSGLSGTTVKYTLSDTHYQFVNWTATNGSFGSVGGSTTSTGNNIIFYPTANNATATANFTEKTFAVTLDNNGTSSTINPGYYTAVATGAHRAKTGYDPVGWKVTSGSVIVGSTTYTVNQVISGDTVSVKATAAASLQATYQVKNNNINASFATTYASGNSVSTTGSGDYDTTYTINVTLADGYDVKKITINGTDNTPTPTVNGNTKTYSYTMPATAVNAVVTLKAAATSFSSVQISDNSTSFPLNTYANGATVDHYLGQPDVFKATATHGTITYTTTKGSDQIESKTNQPSGTVVTMDATYSPSDEPTSENWTDTYTLTVTATNKPTGVAEADKTTATRTYTIRVSLNDTQKYYVKIKNLLNVYIAEDESYNPYYREGAPIQAYNIKRTAAESFITNGGMPAYDALSGTTAYNNAKTAYDEFVEAINNLMLYAKKSTVYVLTKHANSSSAPVKLHIWRGTKSKDDKAHFDMYDYGADKLADDTYKMTYYGKFTKNGDRYMYKFEYTGHIDFLVFKDANNDNIVDNEDPPGYEKLTLDITGCTDFKEYYINAYNADPSNNPTFEPVTDYVDFDIIKAEGKKSIEIGDKKDKAGIKTLLDLQAVSSLVTAPGITVTDTEFKISAPDGRIFNMQNNTYYDPVSGTTKPLTGGLFPADKQGKYTVSYKVRFGYKSDGTTPIVGEITATFWVAYDDINVYIDMNDNIGTPVLYFKYYLNSSGTPVAEGTSGATVEYLPYEMDLVTGSESIYKYTISKKKLEEYALTIDSTHPFKIAYIMVEGKYVDAAGKHDRLADVTPANAFSIPLDARITGEIWYKADNTNFNTFKTISYGSVINTFAAVNESNVVLTDAIKSIRGTGIITDNELIYQNQYAGYDSTVNLPKFHYVLKTVAAQEVKVSGTTYYFDKWVKVKSGVVSSGASGTTLSYSGEALEVIESSDINLTSNPDYNEGDGDYTYFAKYKAVSAASSTVPVRMEITYKFPDYKTSDGNYEYDEKKATVEERYTKTVKVPLGSTYSTFDAVKNAAKTIAENNMPFIQSNYFDYHYEDIYDEEDNLTSFKVDSFDSDTGKINATMALSKTAHKYYIVVGAKTYEGYYQQTKTLNKTECGGSAYSNPVWKDSAGNILAVGDTFDAKFFSSGNESSGNQDCQIITLVNQSGASVNHTTVVSKSYNEVFYKDSTEMVRHNFFIIDYCAEGELLGGGVLFATTDGSGNYRQQNAGTNLSDNTNRTAFIESILGSGANMDVNTEYKAQTIDNTGFRYKPFRSSDDVFRYSKDYNAYLTLFEAENINSGYGDQKIRVFSFMVYNNNGTPTIVISNSFAEVTRMYNYS